MSVIPGWRGWRVFGPCLTRGALRLIVLTCLVTGSGLVPASGAPTPLRLQVASTAAETGVIDSLVAGFRQLHPEIEVAISVAGALEVLDQARQGRADVIITHHPKSEQLFLNEGYGVSRTLVMYNEFVILGPRPDPLGLARERDLRTVLQRLAQEQVAFMVPGLRSATSLALSELWSMAGVKPDWPGYEITGASSAATLKTADLMESYTFADIGTYLANRHALTGNTLPLYRDNIALRNYYSALVVSRQRFPQANQSLAEIFVDYLASPAGQDRLAKYGEQRFGTQVFIPAAHLDDGLKSRRARAELEQKARNLRWMTGLATALAVLVLALTVVSARLRRSEKVRRISEERFRLAVAGTHDGIWDWDLASNLAYLSPRFKEIMGLPEREETFPDPVSVWSRRMHPADRERFTALFDAYLAAGGDGVFTTEYRLHEGTEQPVWIVMRAKALRHATGKVSRMSGSITDVTDRKRQESEMKQLEHRALHDALTGLPNRACLLDHLEQALTAAKQSRATVAMILMDLDEFKQINDNLGHHTGDQVLQQAALRLRQALRVSDTIARLGGDEFAVLLPGSNEANARGVAQKILSAFSAPFHLGKDHRNVGISLGIAWYPDHGQDITTLIENADTAMYTAKRSKSGYVVYKKQV